MISSPGSCESYLAKYIFHLFPSLQPRIIHLLARPPREPQLPILHRENLLPGRREARAIHLRPRAARLDADVQHCRRPAAGTAARRLVRDGRVDDRLDAGDEEDGLRAGRVAQRAIEVRGRVEQLPRRAGGRREADLRAGEEGREVGFEAGGGGLFEGLLEVVEVVGEDVGGGVGGRVARARRRCRAGGG